LNKDLKDTQEIKCNLEKENGNLKNQNFKLQKFNDVLKSKTPFSDVALLIKDLSAAIFDNEERYLRYKRRPAHRSADIVSDLKCKYNQLREEQLLMKYKYDYLLSIFPELSNYVEDEEALISLSNTTNLEQFQDEYDHARDYLSLEEYKRLDDDQRAQLALNRYKQKRRSSSWVAGVEYEMYCSHVLREQGFVVVDYGVQKGLNDLGRDIIATKNGCTYIIQCKRYSEQKEVHENTICQLFGTTLHYKITEKENNLFVDQQKIYPLLITTGKLSQTAKEFASKLDVQVVEWAMGEYPMIKCNINNGNKIYHLPFDQQYWRTRIDQPGEFYAMTVKEATSKGFRRAFRYNLQTKI
jgi:hypothetical protein